jgi:hypothetical protein
MRGGSLLEQIKIDLKNAHDGSLLPVYIDIYDNSLSRKWLKAFNELLVKNYHLEKNYCFFGFPESPRNAEYLCSQINFSIDALNSADIGYQIDDRFTLENTIYGGPVGLGCPGRKIVKGKFNQLHRYFEDLQGVSGKMTEYYNRADDEARWHIRQLNLLCHEFETWVLSYRKVVMAPEWQRPCQLMCWLNAPRFVLEQEDYKLFGIDTICRPLGGVFVGVNKAVGKHHWEVFQDEGRDSRIDELTTNTLRSQTEASGDFDIEWANDPGEKDFMKKELTAFQEWLVRNGFDPADPMLTIGHPQIGQVDLLRTFNSDRWQDIWPKLSRHLNVFAVSTSTAKIEYLYNWDDPDYMHQQVSILKKGK